MSPAGLGASVRIGLRRHAAYLCVWLVVLVGMALVLTAHWRRGLVVVALAAVLAAVLRAMLSDERAGLLAVRGRAVDLWCYGVVGLALGLLAVAVPGYF